MKKISLISLAALAITACNHEQKTETEVTILDTQDQKVSYLMGLENGKGIASTGIEIDIAAYQQGFSDSVEKLDSKIDEAETTQVIQEFQQKNDG